MRTLYIHCGLAKTGTTSIQTFLSGTREELAKLGYDYPSIGLSSVGNAHHNLSMNILKNPAFSPDRGGIEDFFRYLESPDRAPNVVISSENFVNGLSRVTQGDKCFIDFVRATMERNDRVYLVFMFRKFSRFFESMYLQKLKTGRPNSKMPDYVVESKQWLRALLRAMSILSAEIGPENVVVMDLERSGGDALPVFLANIGIPQSKFPVPNVRLNEKMGLKKTSFLYHFQYSAPGVRNHLSDTYVLRAGKVLLKTPDVPGEIFNYRIIPFEDANAIQEVARNEMPEQFVPALAGTAAPETEAYTAVDLPNVKLTKGEIAAFNKAIPRYLAREKMKGQAAAANAEAAAGS